MQKFVHTLSYEAATLWHLCHQVRLKAVRTLALQFVATAYVAAMTMVVIQLAYPANRALPFARLDNGVWVGFQTTSEISAKLQAVNTRKITIAASDKTIEATADELGISANVSATAAGVSNYSFKERLVPFSVASKAKSQYPIIKNYEPQKLTRFTQSLTANPAKEAKDAQLKIEGTTVVVVPGEDGSVFTKDSLDKQLLEANIVLHDQLTLSPETVKPRITTEAANVVAAAVQERINTPIIITVGTQTATADAARIAGWYIVTPAPEKGTIETSFDSAKVKASLKSFATAVYSAPTNTTLVYVDGKQSGQRPGTPGKALMLDDLVSNLVQAQGTAVASVAAKTTPIAPTSVIDRSYTRSSAGLQALIDYWIPNHKGKYGVDLRAIDGSISASSNANKQFTSASIYKLYVESLVYARITAGTLSGSTVTTTGATIDDCLYKMIRVSDNNCAIALGNLIGWSANDGTLHAQGFENTSLSSGNQRTTANDASDWLVSLLNGTLVTGTQRDKLLSAMQQQIYRSGIPAGSKNMVVADKVGFLDGYWHDTAIVYHPKGTYVLTIFSDGAGVSNVADLAAQISQTMNR